MSNSSTQVSEELASLRLDELSYTYPDGTKALQGISFSVRPGESLAIVGANGAGKSTLLQHINGTVVPQSGKVHLGLLPVLKQNLAQIRSKVGMVFQESNDQLFMSTVYDDVAFGPLNLGRTPDEVHSRVLEALQKVGAEHLKDRPSYRLSSGEKRAVAIASVLVMEPSILVMDEPSSNLDPRARRRLMELLSTFPHTKIIATHDLDLALELCPRTLVLHRGSVAADAETHLIFQDQELLERCGLEKPLSFQSHSST